MDIQIMKDNSRGESSIVDIQIRKTISPQGKASRPGETALHIAVSTGKEDIVEELVNEIRMKETMEALKVKNEVGNTPLHLAASIGNVTMCAKIVSAGLDFKDLIGDLIGVRNKDGETPFFLAALNGKKETYRFLHGKCTDSDSSYRRRNNGDTILHCAISGDYFDLAYEITRHYPDLVNAVNMHGITPLHILAGKPSAFRSSSQLTGWWKNIVYHCTFVDELGQQNLLKGSSKIKTYEEECKPAHPENHQTCFNCFRLVGMALGQKQQLVLDNCITCFELVKLLLKAILIFLGIAWREIDKIAEKKKKHIWSVQILDKLLEDVHTYEYEATGGDPWQLVPGEVGDAIAYNNFESDIKGNTSIEFDAKMGQKGLDQNTKEQVGDAIPDDQLPNWTAFKPDLLQLVPKKTNDNKPNTGREIDAEMGKKGRDQDRKEVVTPILVAAKNGILEIVERILLHFPVAIHDMNSKNKNIVLLAVENPQPHLYKFLLKNANIPRDSMFLKVDNDGNSALHLAGMLGDYRPWRIPGAALQMQWEIKRYQFVKDSMPPHFFPHHNKKGQTPRDVFKASHEELVKNGSKWLTKTSESCSVVSALIATVAFATSATIPGGVKQDYGTPTLGGKTGFQIFSISSMVALGFSVTSVVMFLAILTSRFEERDFGKSLPRRLLLGLTSLFVAIAAVLVCFCSRHFFILEDKMRYFAFPLYAVTCLPVTFFAAAQFPLYFDLIRATRRKVPLRTYRVIPPGSGEDLGTRLTPQQKEILD
ncbi:Ankyrin repeat, partial [Dillenia turbinata]